MRGEMDAIVHPFIGSSAMSIVSIRGYVFAWRIKKTAEGYIGAQCCNY
jgi:hypothetical protein